MNYMIQYFRVEWKQTLKHFFRLFAGLSILLIVAGSGAFLMGRYFHRASILQPVKTAVVIPGEQNKVHLITKLLAETDSVKKICQMEIMKEDEAYLALQEGRVETILLLTTDFYDNIMYGANEPARILLNKDSGQRILIFRELIDAGIALIDITEAGVYACTDLISTYPMNMDKYEMQNLLSDRLMYAALTRTQVFQEDLLLPMEGLSVPQYYTTVVFAVLLLSFGIHFTFLYRRQDLTAIQLMKVYGVPPLLTGLVKWVLMSLFIWFAELILYGILLLADGRLALGITEFSLLQPVSLMLPACSAAAFFHAFFACFMGKKTDSLTGILFLLTATVCVMVSGCLFPVSFLVPVWGRIAPWLPLTHWRILFAWVFCDRPMGYTCPLLLLSTVLFVGIGEIVLWKKA